jgi:hypothetical protein
MTQNEAGSTSTTQCVFREPSTHIYSPSAVGKMKLAWHSPCNHDHPAQRSDRAQESESLTVEHQRPDAPGEEKAARCNSRARETMGREPGVEGQKQQRKTVENLCTNELNNQIEPARTA